MILRWRIDGPLRLAALLLLCGLILPVRTQAQTVIDGSRGDLGAETSDAAIELLGKGLKDRVSARFGHLRKGRAGAICGEIDQQNRMGRYTGPRGFVADLAGGFAGIAPDGPELRYAASPQDYRDKQRTLSLYQANCMLD